MKTRSFIPAHFTETIKLIRNSFLKGLMLKKSFIENAYVTGIQWNCHYEAVPMYINNIITLEIIIYFEIYNYQVTFSLSLPFLKHHKLPLISIIYLSLNHELFTFAYQFDGGSSYHEIQFH